MKWFKHMTGSMDDEKLSAVIDELGIEGYGFYWGLLEIVADKLDASNDTTCQFSAQKWGKFFRFSAKKFQKFAQILAENHLISLENSENFIKIDIPNLLKYRDNYQKNKQASNNKVSHRFKIKEEEVDLKEDKSSFCSEPAKQAHALDEEIIANIPLVDGSEFPITQDHLTEFEKAYPAVDVQGELSRIRAWCISNPQKRKTKKGCLRFVNSWLEKAQNRGGTRAMLPLQQPRPASISQQRSRERQIMAQMLLSEPWREGNGDGIGNATVVDGTQPALSTGRQIPGGTDGYRS